MERYYLAESNINPEVILDKGNNIFSIQGKSTPENARDFYAPLMDWLTEYVKQPNEKTVFVFSLEHFNISSSKIILYILLKLKEIVQQKKSVVVKWQYSDAFILGAGRDYAIMSNIPFEFEKISKKEVA